MLVCLYAFTVRNHPDVTQDQSGTDPCTGRIGGQRLHSILQNG